MAEKAGDESVKALYIYCSTRVPRVIFGVPPKIDHGELLLGDDTRTTQLRVYV